MYYRCTCSNWKDMSWFKKMYIKNTDTMHTPRYGIYWKISQKIAFKRTHYIKNNILQCQTHKNGNKTADQFGKRQQLEMYCYTTAGLFFVSWHHLTWAVFGCRPDDSGRILVGSPPLYGPHIIMNIKSLCVIVACLLLQNLNGILFMQLIWHSIDTGPFIWYF